MKSRCARRRAAARTDRGSRVCGQGKHLPPPALHPRPATASDSSACIGPDPPRGALANPPPDKPCPYTYVRSAQLECAQCKLHTHRSGQTQERITARIPTRPVGQLVSQVTRPEAEYLISGDLALAQLLDRFGPGTNFELSLALTGRKTVCRAPMLAVWRRKRSGWRRRGSRGL